MISAQVFMPRRLRDSVDACQRHSVTAFRSNLGMETIGERIRSERERQKITRVDLARAGGIAPTTLSDLELGLSKSTTALHKIASRLGVRPEWLESGRGPKEPTVGDELGSWADVTGYSQTAALGDGANPEAYSEAHKLKFRSSSLRKKGLNPADLHVYYGDGDSMEPRIHNGDAILFDTSDTRIVDNRIYVVRYDGHIYAKRLQVHGDLVFIESDNTADPKWRRPVLVQPGDDFEVIGRVRWIGSWEG